MNPLTAFPNCQYEIAVYRGKVACFWVPWLKYSPLLCLLKYLWDFGFVSPSYNCFQYDINKNGFENLEMFLYISFQFLICKILNFFLRSLTLTWMKQSKKSKKIGVFMIKNKNNKNKRISSAFNFEQKWKRKIVSHYFKKWNLNSAVIEMCSVQT